MALVIRCCSTWSHVAFVCNHMKNKTNIMGSRRFFVGLTLQPRVLMLSMGSMTLVFKVEGGVMIVGSPVLRVLFVRRVVLCSGRTNPDAWEYHANVFGAPLKKNQHRPRHDVGLLRTPSVCSEQSEGLCLLRFFACKVVSMFPVCMRSSSDIRADKCDDFRLCRC